MVAVFPELGLSAYTANDHMAGDVFGFEARGEHGSYAESVDGTAVRALRVTNGSRPAGALLMLAVKSLARTQNHLMVLGRRNANERMAALLPDLGERQGDGDLVRLPMQRNHIARSGASSVSSPSARSKSSTTKPFRICASSTGRQRRWVDLAQAPARARCS